MKNIGIINLILLLALVFVPIISVGGGQTEKVSADAASTVSETIETTTDAPVTEAAKSEEEDIIKVFRTSSKTVEEIKTIEYLVGCVAAEMPAKYHEEALKAQAVAAHTYALRQKLDGEKSPSDALEGAYLTDSSSYHQGYMSEAERKKQWGDNFDEYEEKITNAVKAVADKTIVYDGAPILAAFHSACNGKTEDAVNVWGDEIPYLSSVTSAGDKLSPDYSSTITMTADEFREGVSSIDGVKLGDDPSKWVGESNKTKAGNVIKITVGGKEIIGRDLRSALGLRSCSFDIEYKNKSFSIVTTGYGHSVGMSQYGADYMARQGSDWQEILLHYYSGVKIV